MMDGKKRWKMVMMMMMDEVVEEEDKSPEGKMRARPGRTDGRTGRNEGRKKEGRNHQTSLLFLSLIGRMIAWQHGHGEGRSERALGHGRPLRSGFHGWPERLPSTFRLHLHLHRSILRVAPSFIVRRAFPSPCRHHRRQSLNPSSASSRDVRFRIH